MYFPCLGEDLDMVIVWTSGNGIVLLWGCGRQFVGWTPIFWTRRSRSVRLKGVVRPGKGSDHFGNLRDVAVTALSSMWCVKVTWRESVKVSLTYRPNLTDRQVSLEPLKLACHDHSSGCMDISNIQERRQDDVCFAHKLANWGWLVCRRDILHNDAQVLSHVQEKITC